MGVVVKVDESLRLKAPARRNVQVVRNRGLAIRYADLN